jgi:diadenosine tetraphosphate (Ap4A) HIT family hydrolase
MYDAAHATRPSELELQAWRELCSDVWLVERAVTRVFQPDHVNLETLGNTVPHLHTAIIPRYRSDPRWGHPIWMTQRQDMPQVPISDLECERLAQVLRPELSY